MQCRQQSHALPALLRMLARALLMALALDVSLHYLCPPSLPSPSSHPNLVLPHALACFSPICRTSIEIYFALFFVMRLAPVFS